MLRERSKQVSTGAAVGVENRSVGTAPACPGHTREMRDVVVMMSVSLDGFIEGPDRDLGWHQVDEELHTHFNERLAAMGAFIDGGSPGS